MRQGNELLTPDYLIEYQGWERVQTVNLFTELTKGKYKMMVRDNDFPLLLTITIADTGKLVFRQYVQTIYQYKKYVQCRLK